MYSSEKRCCSILITPPQKLRMNASENARHNPIVTLKPVQWHGDRTPHS